ncbi:uncharacterized protein [Argopecten irradians]|uniref:uncharacterized protein isoform X3 n=1 Tax=Argopecten irradians TaxID=31199 RepID=UPI00371F44A0
MELQQLVAVTVNTLDKHFSDVKVSIALQENNTVLGEDVKRKICEELGLKPSSHELFSLFLWNSKAEILHRVRDTDRILCPVKGRLFPTKEQELRLEELLDPGFTIEEQYIHECQKMKNYFSVRVDNCSMSLRSEDEFTQLSLSEQLVNVVVLSEGVVVDAGQHAVTIPFFCIRSWSLNTVSSLIQYSYKSGTNPDVKLSLGSNQFRYLHDATMEAIKDYRIRNNDSSSFFSSMTSTSPDGTVTIQENAVFDADKAMKYYIDFQAICL